LSEISKSWTLRRQYSDPHRSSPNGVPTSISTQHFSTTALVELLLSAAMTTHTVTTFRYDAVSTKFIKKTSQRTLGLNEVKIKVTHSGICFTDVHAKDKACGLGHEGVGLVIDFGANVTSMKLGDRVGWG
jgi:hypothetical protein